VCIGGVTSASANGRRHQPRLARIGRGMSASGKRHPPTACNISQDLHTSVVACVHRLGNISRGLRASASLRQPTKGSTSQGLHASDVACTHLASDVGQRPAAASKAGTHQPWRVHISWATLPVAFPHPSSDIVRGMRASKRRYWPTVGSISHGMPA